MQGINIEWKCASSVWNKDKTTGSSSGLLKLRDGVHCFPEICVLPSWWLPRQNRRTICLPAGPSEGAYWEAHVFDCGACQSLQPRRWDVRISGERQRRGKAGERGMHRERAPLDYVLLLVSFKQRVVV